MGGNVLGSTTTSCSDGPRFHQHSEHSGRRDDRRKHVGAVTVREPVGEPDSPIGILRPRHAPAAPPHGPAVDRHRRHRRLLVVVADEASRLEQVEPGRYAEDPGRPLGHLPDHGDHPAQLVSREVTAVPPVEQDRRSAVATRGQQLAADRRQLDHSATAVMRSSADRASSTSSGSTPAYRASNTGMVLPSCLAT